MMDCCCATDYFSTTQSIQTVFLIKVFTFITYYSVIHYTVMCLIVTGGLFSLENKHSAIIVTVTGLMTVRQSHLPL